MKLIHCLFKLLHRNHVKFRHCNPADFIVQHAVLHGGHLDFAPGNGHIHILVLVRPVYRDGHVRAFFALDVIVHQHIKAFGSHQGTAHLIYNVPWLHPCLQGRGTLEHLHDGA